MEAVPGNASTEEGLRLLKAGQTNEAIEVLGRVLQADSDDALAHMYIGIAYNQKNDKLHAIHHLEESLRLDETAKGYYNLALVYEAANRVDEAIREYKMALELDPNYTKAQEALKKLHDQFESAHKPPDSGIPEASVAGEPVQAAGPQARAAAAAPVGAGAKAPGPVPGPVPGPTAGPVPGPAQIPGMPGRPVGGPPPNAWLMQKMAEEKKIRDAQRELTRSGVIYGAICGAFLFLLLNLIGAFLVSIFAGSMAIWFLLMQMGFGAIYGGLVGFWIGYTAGDEMSGVLAGAVLGFVYGVVIMLINTGDVGAAVVGGAFYALFGAAGGWIIGKLVASSIGGV